MPNVFYDRIIDFKQYDINLNDNVFEKILEIRKNKMDSNRFFLKYITPEELSKYDFNNKESLKEFRDICLTDTPIKGMAGCNLREEVLEENLGYGGIKMSDPNKKIIGQFFVRDGNIYYSPLFEFFYEERDLIKFANDKYFTTIPFEDLVMNQIGYVKKFYLHTRYPRTTKEIIKYGDYIMEEINKNQMIDYLKDPEQGQKIYNKYLDKITK